MALLLRLGQDHLLHDGQALLFHEHMLGAAETDALSAKGDGPAGVAGIVGIRPYTKAAILVGPVQQLLQFDFLLKVGIDGLNDTGEDFACGTIDGDIVAFTQDEIGVDDAEKMLGFVNTNTLTAGDTRKSQATRPHGAWAFLAPRAGDKPFATTFAG